MDSRPAAIAAFLDDTFSRWGMACAALLAVALGIGGCSLFHHNAPTAQQRFVEALEHGNGPQANQIWLHMTDKERADWSHSVGMKPDFSKEDIENKLMQHAQEQADQDGDDSSDTSSGMSSDQVDTGNIDSQIIDMPGLDADPTAGSLQNLPGLSGTGSTEPLGTGSTETPEAPVLLP
jgi:hypothetical protein